MSDKIKLCCICGPTASGKTSVGVNVAKFLDSEVISADSMQIYNEISVSTAKPNKIEMQGVKHHLIGHVSIFDDYSVARYVEEAKSIINKIHKEGKIPVIVGGTGLYIDSLLNNIEFLDSNCNIKRRNELKEEAEKFGNIFLFEKLRKIDRESVERIHVNDINRIIRALEIFEQTGKTMTQQISESKSKGSPYDVCKIGLYFEDRSMLYEKINLRVDEMIKNGLVNEAKIYYDIYNNAVTSSQAIGIKELFPYFNGESSLNECIDNIKMETRRYAKRQISWFKRDKNTQWFNMSDPFVQKNLINFVKNYW